MKEYLVGVKKWTLIFFIIALGTAMSWGTMIIIFLIFKGQIGYILIFIAYPFLIPLFTIAGKTVFRQENKSKRPIWFDISPPIPPPPPKQTKADRGDLRSRGCYGARCVATSTNPVHPPKK